VRSNDLWRSYIAYKPLKSSSDRSPAAIAYAQRRFEIPRNRMMCLSLKRSSYLVNKSICFARLRECYLPAQLQLDYVLTDVDEDWKHVTI
jgi:hypothetical protein